MVRVVSPVLRRVRVWKCKRGFYVCVFEGCDISVGLASDRRQSVVCCSRKCAASEDTASSGSAEGGTAKVCDGRAYTHIYVLI